MNLIGALDDLIAKKRDLKQAAMQSATRLGGSASGFRGANAGFGHTEQT